MHSFTMTEVRTRAGRFYRATRDGVVRITRRNHPSLAVMPWAEYESLMETLEVLSDNDLLRQIKAGEHDAVQGLTISWDEAEKRLDTTEEKLSDPDDHEEDR